MGATQIKGREKLQKLNEHFLCMQIYPQENKMCVEVYVPSSIALNRWSSQLVKVGQAQPENILIPQQSRVVERGACGDGVRLQIEFECYYIGLSEQIDKRGECEKYLQEAQMWYLMFCLSESAASCSRVGSRIGDVRPQNVLLSRQGKLKIISRLSLPNYCDPVLSDRKNKLLLSPEELELIRKGYKENPLDYVLSESFSIGMTLLSTGVLQDLSKCYDYGRSELAMLEFNRVLSFWQQNEFYSELQKRTVRYSERLKGLVVGLLNVNPEKRMSSLELYELLKPHMIPIMKMEPFDLDARRVSPMRKLENVSGGKEVIHMLRSRKKGAPRTSPRKREEREEGMSRNVDLQFSFRSPVAMTESNKKSWEGSTSPKHKIKLSTSFNILKHLEQHK